jgi:hypothetical protein
VKINPDEDCLGLASLLVLSITLLAIVLASGDTLVYSGCSTDSECESIQVSFNNAVHAVNAVNPGK